MMFKVIGDARSHIHCPQGKRQKAGLKEYQVWQGQQVASRVHVSVIPEVADNRQYSAV